MSPTSFPIRVWATRVGAPAAWREMAAGVVAATIGMWAPPAQGQRVLGIDVSAYQGNLSMTNWATLHRRTDQQVNGTFGDGRDFVFIRSSRGGTTGYYDQN